MDPLPDTGTEREAFDGFHTNGFSIRHPPPPHDLHEYITADEKLFQTIHMGAPIIDDSRYRLVVDGHVERRLSLTLDQLKKLPQTSITAIHECYGSPLKPPTDALWRIGNVKWTGVQLSHLLTMAGITLTKEDSFVWSDGLDRGTFAGIEADRYQKDLPMSKALQPEVLAAYMLNGQPLDRERGGPVRLVVPGWFGTNSTKWLCRLSVQKERALGPYTTTLYNEMDPTDPEGIRMRAVWEIDVNSMITRPVPNEILTGPEIVVQGWTWSDAGVAKADVSGDNGGTWVSAVVAPRFEFGWQRFNAVLQLPPGCHKVIAKATSSSGEQQPLAGRRNHVHRVDVEVKEC